MTGSTFKTQIPETLADGDYLVRHEVSGCIVRTIAMSNLDVRSLLYTMRPTGAVSSFILLGTSIMSLSVKSKLRNFSSFQVRIKNSNAGNATVTASKTLSFPGAYTANDPGLLVDVFSQAADGSEYKFPAGPIANVSAPGATGNPPNAIASLSASVSETSAVASATLTSATTTSTVSSASIIKTRTSTSTPVTSTSVTSNSAATATPTSLQTTRLANGRTAQELNFRFKSLAVSDKCEPRDPGCVDGQFAVCSPEGTWVKQGSCFMGTSCFAVPLTNANGTQVGCFPEYVVEQAMIDSGAGRAIATETASSAPVATVTSTGSVVSISASATSTSSFGRVTSTSAVSRASAVSSSSTITPSASSTTTATSTSAVPTTTLAGSHGGGAPAVVIGVGSKPARRMLRWERRGYY